MGLTVLTYMIKIFLQYQAYTFCKTGFLSLENACLFVEVPFALCGFTGETLF